MKPARDGAAAAFDARAEAAGTIASSIGSASVAPTPRRNVRRDRCILVMNIRPLVLSARCRRHLKRYAANDTRNEGGKPVILATGVPHDFCQPPAYFLSLGDARGRAAEPTSCI